MGKTGRPKHTPLTDDQIEMAGYMTLAGVPQKTIAKKFGLPETTYRDNYRDFIDTFLAERHSSVVGSLFASIKKGDVASILFYLKTQCGWKEKEVDLSSDTIEKIAAGVNRPREMGYDEWKKFAEEQRAKSKQKASK